MADFNQSPSGQTAVAFVVGALAETDPLGSDANAAVIGMYTGEGGGITFPTTGQQWPLGHS
jgi:hypothetical protein